MASRLPLLLLVTLLFALVVFLVRDTHQSVSEPLEGQGFAITPAAASQLAPDFTLQEPDGKQVKLSDEVKKGPVVIDFWAIWCDPCRVELPELNAISRTYQAHGVGFNAINSDASVAGINHFFRAGQLSFPVLVDTGGSVARQYEVESLPSTLVVDRNRKIRAVGIGYDPEMQADLPDCLDKLLKEQ